MNIKNKKHAYTLAEIMLVILVLTIIFAAFAPMFTKRALTATKGKYAVWSYADPDSLDAYTDPGDPSLTGQLFFGLTPTTKDAVQEDFLPKAKLVIRSGEVTSAKVVQRQLQFRYGRDSSEDAGSFAGSWLVLNNNMLLGGGYKNIVKTSNGAKYNVAVGYSALNALNTGTSNTALGAYALQKLQSGKNNVALGYQAGYSITSSAKNTLLGSSAGYKLTGKDNTFIGYNAGQEATSGEFNTFVGAYAAHNSRSGSKNVAIGYKALDQLNSGENNTALGSFALENLTEGSNNVAIGFNACGELKKGSNKTCIGYNAGPHSGSAADNYIGVTAGNDDYIRTYIGSKPNPENFGGDAVLEIHNLSSQTIGIMEASNNSNPSDATTVINGNLIVKGRPYFTVGNALQHFYDVQNGDISYYGYKDTTDYRYAECTNSLQGPWSSWKDACVQLGTNDVTSDRRLKNITTRNNTGLSAIQKLKVYNYTFKNDPKKLPQIGVMAQDLQKVFPNSVFEGEDGYLRIKWDEMFYAAINAIKELDQKIVALVKRTTNVETQISKLEKENIVLKSQVDSLTARVNKLKAQ